MSTIGNKPKWKKYLGIVVFVLIAAGTGIFYVQYYFVVAEGIKNGQLNYFTYKGYIFKTYEGRLIQVGIRPGTSGQGVQSNDFVFSVEKKEVAKQLETLSGKELQLHYREYNKSIPWRGHEKYVVDSIVAAKEPAPGMLTPM